MWIYLLVLQIMPCNDSCSSEIHEFTLSIEQAQDHHEHEGNLCTPFCFCTCCATPVIIYQIVNVKVENSNNISYSEYIQPNLSHFSHAIWQPPKIG